VNQLEDFYFVNNTVINQYSGNIKYFNTVPATGINTFKIYNNIFASVTGANNTFISGNTPGALDTAANVFSTNYLSLGFTDPSVDDYSLTTAATSAIDLGVNAGITSTAFSLTPFNMYISSADTLLPRTISGGVIDIGAYEYSGNASVLENGFWSPIHVYPNPSDGNFQLSLDGINFTKGQYFKIYALNGETVYQSTVVNSNLKIDLGNCAKGIYLIKLYDGNKTIAKSIVLK
jgi:hypothetical protein